MLGIAYNAQATSWFTGTYGVESQGHGTIAKDLFQSLVQSSCALGTNPFVLVGHSYGGIVIASLVVRCYDLFKRPMENRTNLSPGERESIDNATRFMANLKGVVFFGVPQKGSMLAALATWINMIIPLCIGKSVSSDLVPSSEGIAELMRNFQIAIQCQPGVVRFAFGETKKTGLWRFIKCMVVNRESAQGNLDWTDFMALNETDHRTVCKFNTKEAEGFTRFVIILSDIIKTLDQAPEAMRAPMNGIANSGYQNRRTSATYLDEGLARSRDVLNREAVEQIWPRVYEVEQSTSPDVPVNEEAQALLRDLTAGFRDLVLSEATKIFNKGKMHSKGESVPEHLTITVEHVRKGLECLDLEQFKREFPADNEERKKETLESPKGEGPWATTPDSYLYPDERNLAT